MAMERLCTMTRASAGERGDVGAYMAFTLRLGDRMLATCVNLESDVSHR